MAAVYPAEEMHAGAFDLIASGTPEGGLADRVQIGIDLGSGEGPDMQAAGGKMVPDACPVAKHDSGCQQPVLLSGQPCQLLCRLVTAFRLAEHLAVEFQNLVGCEKQLAGNKLVRVTDGLPFHFGEDHRNLCGRHGLGSGGGADARLVYAGRKANDVEAGAFQQAASRGAGRCQDQGA